MKKKQPRRKLNKNEIDKKIKENFKRKFSFLFDRPKTVEFIAPAENFSNRSLGHDKLLMKVSEEGKIVAAGNLGQVKYFYIPEDIYKSLTDLFIEYKIPQNLMQDLTWAFLNMVFASCHATYSNRFNEEYEKNQKEVFETLEILESLSIEKLSLSGISLEYQEQRGRDKNGRLNLGPVKHKKIKGYMAVQYVEKVLHLFRQEEGFKIYRSIQDIRDEHGKSDPLMGHKNSEKQSQSFYSFALEQYLVQQLYEHVGLMVNDLEKLREETKRLDKLYPRNKRLLFIARLMQLSGLLEKKESQDEDAIIETVEKKIGPRRKGHNSRKSLEKKIIREK